MKKLFIAILLITIAGTTLAFSQTKKRVTRKRPKTSGVTKVAPKPVPTFYIPARASAAVTTDSGLTYIITHAGGGAQLKAGDTVSVHYTGLLTNGLKFDSSYDRNEPISFQLGAGKVIKGWDEGLQKLRVGDRATFFIPPAIAYGTRGAGGGLIPPDATLIFVIEVVGVQ